MKLPSYQAFTEAEEALARKPQAPGAKPDNPAQVLFVKSSDAIGAVQLSHRTELVWTLSSGKLLEVLLPGAVAVQQAAPETVLTAIDLSKSVMANYCVWVQLPKYEEAKDATAALAASQAKPFLPAQAIFAQSTDASGVATLFDCTK